MKMIKYLKEILILLILTSLMACDSYPSGVIEVENVTISLSNVYPRRGEVISTKLIGNLEDFVSVTWDFGDGTTSNEAITTKTYDKDGVYQISVKYQTKSEEEKTKTIMVKVTGLALSEALKDLDANPSKIWVMAHRGNTANKNIPENSLAALEATIAAGVDVIEIDTHITKDGVVMVCHDESINRTTNGQGKIPEMTFAEIREFRLLDLNGKVSSEVMPTLQEMLEAGRGRIYFNLDYSPRTASTQEVFKIVQNAGMIEGTFFYTGGNHAFMTELFSYDKNCHPYAWGGSQSNYEPSMGQDRRFFVQLDYTGYDSQATKNSQKDGMFVSFNVLNENFETPFLKGDYTTIDNLINSGVRMIQTDIPKSVIAYLESKGHR